MAFLECHFQSAVLGRAVSVNVILPQTPFQPAAVPPETRFPVLYLLHGLSDDATMWFRRSSIERYADIHRMAVVMPDGGRCFYSDAVAGEKMWTFISEELPFIIESSFPVSQERKDTFAAGLSMGGYGAIKLGLRRPEKFAAVAGLSTLADLKYRFRAADTASWRPELRRIFGSSAQLASRSNDLFALGETALASGKPLPQILSICGTDDFMIRDNRRFNRHMAKIGYPDFFAFERPGAHTWEFWDRHIQDVLNFFMSGKLPE